VVNRLLAVFGVLASFALVLAALWVWQNAAALTYTLDKPDAAALAARLAAIGLAAAGQMVIAMLVLSRIYRRDVVTNIYGLSAAAIFLMSVTGAVIVAVAR
jgi:hypothetical protein